MFAKFCLFGTGENGVCFRWEVPAWEERERAVAEHERCEVADEWQCLGVKQGIGTLRRSASDPQA